MMRDDKQAPVRSPLSPSLMDRAPPLSGDDAAAAGAEAGARLLAILDGDVVRRLALLVDHADVDARRAEQRVDALVVAEARRIVQRGIAVVVDGVDGHLEREQPGHDVVVAPEGRLVERRAARVGLETRRVGAALEARLRVLE